MKTPETWNWIEARLQCSINQMFILLVARLQDDVTQVEKLARSKNSRSMFGLAKVSDSHVIVSRKDDIGGMWTRAAVSFERSESSVAVTWVDGNGAKKPMFSVKPSLCLDGRCRFFLETEPFELWQVSNAALGDLFFERWRD